MCVVAVGVDTGFAESVAVLVDDVFAAVTVVSMDGLVEFVSFALTDDRKAVHHKSRYTTTTEHILLPIILAGV